MRQRQGAAPKQTRGMDQTTNSRRRHHRRHPNDNGGERNTTSTTTTTHARNVVPHDTNDPTTTFVQHYYSRIGSRRMTAQFGSIQAIQPPPPPERSSEYHHDTRNLEMIQQTSTTNSSLGAKLYPSQEVTTYT